MNFRFVTEIFCSESSITTCEAYLLWLLEQHHYHHRNKFWELVFSFVYFLNQSSGFDCKFTFIYLFFYFCISSFILKFEGFTLLQYVRHTTWPWAQIQTIPCTWLWIKKWLYLSAWRQNLWQWKINILFGINKKQNAIWHI